MNKEKTPFEYVSQRKAELDSALEKIQAEAEESRSALNKLIANGKGDSYEIVRYIENGRHDYASPSYEHIKKILDCERMYLKLSKKRTLYSELMNVLAPSISKEIKIASIERIVSNTIYGEDLK